MSRVLFNISYKVKDDNLIESYQLDVQNGQVSGGGSSGNQLILQATYPDGASRYYISLSLDGAHVSPMPSSSGFSSIQDMMSWINNYWYVYGNWYWLSAQNKIVLYVFSERGSTGELNLTASNNVLSALIPDLPFDSYYYVVFTEPDSGIDNNPTYVTPTFPPETAVSKQDILDWVTQNWGSYGTWTISGNYLILTSDNSLEGYSLSVETDTNGFAFDLGYSTGFDS